MSWRRQEGWEPAIAGAGAGLATTIVCSPLDVAKTRLQVQGAILVQESAKRPPPGGAPPSPAARRRSPPNAAFGVNARHSCTLRAPKYVGLLPTLGTIWAEEGVRGWFRGLAPALVTMPLFWGLYWATYEHAKSSLGRALGRGADDALTHVLSACAAGAAADFVTNPLWVVRTRMQTAAAFAGGAPPLTMLGEARSLLMHEGPRAFLRVRARARSRRGPTRARARRRHARAAPIFAPFFDLFRTQGLGASLLGLSHVAVQFPVYERLKRFARERRRAERGGAPGDDELPALELVGASVTSKLLASTVSYPHEAREPRAPSLSVVRSLSRVIHTRAFALAFALSRRCCGRGCSTRAAPRSRC